MVHHISYFQVLCIHYSRGVESNEHIVEKRKTMQAIRGQHDLNSIECVHPLHMAYEIS